MKIAHIYNGLVREIFESDIMPQWGPYSNGQIPLLVDITGQDANPNDGWNPGTEQVVQKPIFENRIVEWDANSFTFKVETDEEKEIREAKTQIEILKNKLAGIDQETFTARPVREILLRYAVNTGTDDGDAFDKILAAEIKAAPLRDELRKTKSKLELLIIE